MSEVYFNYFTFSQRHHDNGVGHVARFKVTDEASNVCAAVISKVAIGTSVVIPELNEENVNLVRIELMVEEITEQSKPTFVME